MNADLFFQSLLSKPVFKHYSVYFYVPYLISPLKMNQTVPPKALSSQALLIYTEFELYFIHFFFNQPQTSEQKSFLAATTLPCLILINGV